MCTRANTSRTRRRGRTDSKRLLVDLAIPVFGSLRKSFKSGARGPEKRGRLAALSR